MIGASTGIGAATAKALLAAGARVGLPARSADKLREVAADQARALVEPLDVTDAVALPRAEARINAVWGGIDLALVVAGTHREIRASDLTAENSRELLETNLQGAINAVAAVLPGLLARGQGAIGIVASVAGYSGLTKSLVYGASKAAPINFTETLYLDLNPRGPGVYLIMPGFVKTPLTDRNDFHMPHLVSAEEAAREIMSGLPAGKFEIHFPRAFTRQLKLMRLLPYPWHFRLIRRATGV